MGERERKCERGGVLEMEEEREGVGTAKRKRGRESGRERERGRDRVRAGERVGEREGGRA